MINIDFETSSATDLLTEGVYNYATCPSTQVICMAYSVDGQEPLLWHPGEPVPDVFHVEHYVHVGRRGYRADRWIGS